MSPPVAPTARDPGRPAPVRLRPFCLCSRAPYAEFRVLTGEVEVQVETRVLEVNPNTVFCP